MMKANNHYRLPVDIDLSAISGEAFRAYLLHCQLSYLQVAQAANIHQVSVYNMANGVPVLPEHAESARVGLLELTGEPYTAFIYTIL